MPSITISNRRIGPTEPCWIVAELSGNHLQDYANAHRLVIEAWNAGVDAIKVQCFQPDDMTLNVERPEFRIPDGPWEGRHLYDLYSQTYMPWDWIPKLKTLAESLGLIFFSSVFDRESVDFCESWNCPAFKIASFELVDLPLIRYAASKGRPMILSTGMASIADIWSALRECQIGQVGLLKCTSAYPTPITEANLQTISQMAFSQQMGSHGFALPVGLSDHTLGIAVPVAAVALGACIIEKHLCLDRSASGPDSGFSLEPHEFKAMVENVRIAEKAIGSVQYGATESERANLRYRRSLFVVEDCAAGEPFTGRNVRSIRPAAGLHPRHLDEVIGRRAVRDVKRGTPLEWGMME